MKHKESKSSKKGKKRQKAGTGVKKQTNEGRQTKIRSTSSLSKANLFVLITMFMNCIG
jgi:hypothetical protein